MEHPTTQQSAESRAAKLIREIFESGRPITYVHTAEEQRVGNVLRGVFVFVIVFSCVAEYHGEVSRGVEPGARQIERAAMRPFENNFKLAMSGVDDFADDELVNGSQPPLSVVRFGTFAASPSR